MDVFGFIGWLLNRVKFDIEPRSFRWSCFLPFVYFYENSFLSFTYQQQCDFRRNGIGRIECVPSSRQDRARLHSEQRWFFQLQNLPRSPVLRELLFHSIFISFWVPFPFNSRHRKWHFGELESEAKGGKWRCGLKTWRVIDLLTDWITAGKRDFGQWQRADEMKGTDWRTAGIRMIKMNDKWH